MNILLLGSGGREHALAWKIAQSPLCMKLFIAPGNGGTHHCGSNVALDTADHRAVLEFCSDNNIGLVVIGPEAPLVDGLADTLRAKGVPTFGPSAQAAQLEGSKAYTKALCDRMNIPTARYAAFDSRDAARNYLETQPTPIVVKVDGLAAGRGVTVADTRAQALQAVDAIFADGPASVVIEECLFGEEVSAFYICDGTKALPFGTAQDHKRVGDGDTGPNTGGMGAYSPARILTPQLQEEVISAIIEPTLRGMANAGAAFLGVLYAGLMLTSDGPKLIEYNVRFGDPECQVLMMLLESDIVPVLLASANGVLGDIKPSWSDKTALTVVMAAKGYPADYTKGTPIELPSDLRFKDGMIFHAGTATDGDTLVSVGGRVLCVTATGASVAAAQASAYELVDWINWPEGFCRRDIGWRAIERDATDA